MASATKKQTKSKPAIEPAPEVGAITSIKGFDSNLACKGDGYSFQFELGKSFTHEGNVKACQSGFHACPVEHHPLSVFEFYPPAGSRYAEVQQGGATSAKETKLASATIAIGVELAIGDLVKRAWDYVWSRATLEDGSSATGYRGAASALGKFSSALATGYGGKVSGVEDSILHLEERVFNPGASDHGKPTAAWSGIVGRDGIKPDTFYTLSNGKPVEA